MTEIQAKHSEMVSKLVKPGEEIVATLTASEAHIIHMVMGICGEAGEILDAMKKAVIYRKPLDIENVIEELGDIEFYLEGLRQKLDISRDQVLEANYEKLGKRYAGHNYSDKAAQERADKVGQPA